MGVVAERQEMRPHINAARVMWSGVMREGMKRARGSMRRSLYWRRVMSNMIGIGDYRDGCGSLDRGIPFSPARAKSMDRNEGWFFEHFPRSSERRRDFRGPL